MFQRFLTQSIVVAGVTLAAEPVSAADPWLKIDKTNEDVYLRQNRDAAVSPSDATIVFSGFARAPSNLYIEVESGGPQPIPPPELCGDAFCTAVPPQVFAAAAPGKVHLRLYDNDEIDRSFETTLLHVEADRGVPDAPPAAEPVSDEQLRGCAYSEADAPILDSREKAAQAAMCEGRRLLARRAAKRKHADHYDTKSPSCPLKPEDEAALRRHTKKALNAAGCAPGPISSPGDNFVVLLFDEDGVPYGSAPRVDENDKVVVFVVGEKPLRELRRERCGEAPPVRIGGGVSMGRGLDLTNQVRESRAYYESVSVEGCSADEGIEISWRTGSGDSEERKSTGKVSVTELYRLTLGVAAIFDFTVTRSFHARPVRGETVPVIVEDQKMAGISTIAFVALRFARVDAYRVRRISQWFAPALGFSFRSPLEHLYAGLLVEPFPGVGLIAGYHFHREQRVGNGYSVGDRVTTGAVPVDERWASPGSDLFVGTAFDVALFVRLVKGLRGK